MGQWLSFSPPGGGWFQPSWRAVLGGSIDSLSQYRQGKTGPQMCVLPVISRPPQWPSRFRFVG